MASYCAGCGASLSSGARFCSVCGNAVTEPGPVGGSGPARAPNPLIRPFAGRKLAGVCQGLADQYGWDVTLVRVITVLLAVFTFPIGLIVYGLFWLIVPEGPRPLPSATHLDTAR
jgi:phage shock protein C